MTDSAAPPSGTLDLPVLTAVSPGKPHGHGVPLRIEQVLGGALQARQGALYPAPYRPEHPGLTEGERGVSGDHRRARFHRLATAGRARLGEEAGGWNRHADAVAPAPGATPREVRA